MSRWTVRRPLIVFLVLVNIVFLGVIFWLAPKAFRARVLTNPGPELPVIAPVRAFTLTREDGSAFSSEALRGRPWLASFIFTRCPGACPMMSGRFAVLQDTLPASFRLLSISVDPGHDTPAVIREYAAKFYARPERWIWLTGDVEVIKGLQADMKLSVSDDPGMHSLRFILIDADGNVRGYYDWQDPASLEKLSQDARKLEKK